MLKGAAQELSREHTERALNNQYQRLQKERSKADSKALVAAALLSQQTSQFVNAKQGKLRSKFIDECSKCQKWGHR